jgi:hypothetical protein
VSASNHIQSVGRGGDGTKSASAAAEQETQLGVVKTAVERQLRDNQWAETITGLPFKWRFGAKTAFDHDKCEVIIGLGQLVNFEITDPRILAFIVGHELGHFKEMVDDPDGYKRVIDEGTRSDGLGKAYFRFYNALMDIYVNTNTRNLTAVYGADDFTPDIKDLYRTKLFKERDLEKLPLATQFSYYILNAGMGVADDLKVSPQVRARVDGTFTVYGTHFGLNEIIDKYLRPAIGIRNSREWQATVGQRKVVIDRALRPIFDELIKLDTEQQNDPNKGIPSGDLEGVEGELGDLKAAVDYLLKQRAEDRKSPEEKAADQRAKSAAALSSKHLSQAEANALAETTRRVHPTIVELVNLFKNLIFQSVDYQKNEEGYFKKGSTLSINRVISQFAKISDEPKVMTRSFYEEVRSSAPREVRVWLSLDLSGSMDGDIKLLRDISLAFAGALQTLSAGAQIGAHTLRGSLGIVGFSDEAIDVLSLTKDPTYEHIAKAYSHLTARGGTSEHLALERIYDATKKDPPTENRVDIVVGITDGDTSDPTASQKLVGELETLGVQLAAFKFHRGYVAPDVPLTPEEMLKQQVNGPHPPPRDTFESIWRTNRSGQLGWHVRSANEVPAAMAHRLGKLIKRDG